MHAVAASSAPDAGHGVACGGPRSRGGLARSEDVRYRSRLRLVFLESRSVGEHGRYVFRVNVRIGKRLYEALPRSAPLFRDLLGELRAAGGAEARDLRVNLDAPCLCVFLSLEHEHRRAFAHYQARSVRRKTASGRARARSAAVESLPWR